MPEHIDLVSDIQIPVNNGKLMFHGHGIKLENIQHISNIIAGTGRAYSFFLGYQLGDRCEKVYMNYSFKRDCLVAHRELTKLWLETPSSPHLSSES